MFNLSEVKAALIRCSFVSYTMTAFPSLSELPGPVELQVVSGDSPFARVITTRWFGVSYDQSGSSVPVGQMGFLNNRLSHKLAVESSTFPYSSTQPGAPWEVLLLRSCLVMSLHGPTSEEPTPLPFLLGCGFSVILEFACTISPYPNPCGSRYTEFGEGSLCWSLLTLGPRVALVNC